MARRALLIHNPAAGLWGGHERRVARLERLLAGSGLAVSAAATSGPGDAERLARTAAEGGYDFVFSYGGDGTLRECAAGLLGSATALAFLPGGTANVMSHVVDVPADPLSAAARLAAGTVREIDVGFCGRRPFLMQASAGLDAEVMARLAARRKRLLGRVEVGLSLTAALFSYGFPPFSVRWPGGDARVTFAAVTNIPFYGGRWRLAPAARCDDGRLDLVLFRGRGPGATLGLVRDLALGRHLGRQDVEHRTVERAEFSRAPGLAVQIDGDVVADALPAVIRVARRRLRVVFPAGR